MKARYLIIAGVLAGAFLWVSTTRAQQPAVQWQAVNQAITNIQTQLNSLQSQITKIGTPLSVPSTPAHDVIITEGGSFALLNMPLDTFLLGNGVSVDPSALAVPNCTDVTGNHLNYSTTTHTLNCGTSSGNPNVSNATGTLSVANGGTGLTTTFTSPGGRLTLTTATPVMTADATAQGTIYYDTYVSNVVPVAGSNLTIAGNEISLILDSTNQTSGHEYDVFAINVSGALTLCAGPAWTNDTTRSQAIALSAGVWTNSGSMAHCFNNAVDKGPISGTAGTYLGTLRTTANAQTGMQFHPAAASGGSNNVLDLYNAYNRVLYTSTQFDNVGNYSLTSQSWRVEDGNNNTRISFVDGLGQSVITGLYEHFYTTSSTSVHIGIDLNSTSNTPQVATAMNNGSGGSITVQDAWIPTLGFNFIQAMERIDSANSATGFQTLSSDQVEGLVLSIWM